MIGERSGDGRLNWLDWLILLGVLGAVIGLAIRMLGSTQRGEERVRIEYTLCISGVRREEALLLESSDGPIPIGATVKSANGTVNLGEVRALWSNPTPEVCLRDGELILTARADRADVYLRVAAEATLREGDGLRVGDVRIAAADTGDFRLGGYLARGARVISVEEVE